MSDGETQQQDQAGESDQKSELQNNLEQAIAQKKHWREKAKKYEQQLNNSDGTSTAESENDAGGSDPEPVEPGSNTQDSAPVTQADLRLRDEGYNSKEASMIKRYAKQNGLSVDDALENDFVQGGIERMRARSSAKEATPSPSSGRPTGSSNDSLDTPQERRQELERRLAKDKNQNA